MMEKAKSKNEAIGNRLALARKQAGLSQGQVANLLNLHRPAVSEMEAGRRNVTAAELSQLSKTYDVSVDWLSCTDADKANLNRDRIELAARELAKLKKEDLTKVLDLLSALRKSEATK